MIVDKACFERGCACYDDRVDGPGVEVVGTPVDKPVAYVSGYYGGRCVIAPVNPAMLFSLGTALYIKENK